jgi:predicted Abi (CAAX) family protease
MYTYLRNNYWQGLKTSPLHTWKVSVLVTVPYLVAALIIGFMSGLFELAMLRSSMIWFLPFALFIFPSFLEESIFRGLLIPNNARERGTKYIIRVTLVSSAIFVLWHPLNALTINPAAKAVFLNPYFLLIAFLLGIATAMSYIYSKSLWAPVIIHWLTVVVWVLFLGGRNLILE